MKLWPDWIHRFLWFSWSVVNGKCKTARSRFSVSPRHFEFFNGEIETSSSSVLNASSRYLASKTFGHHLHKKKTELGSLRFSLALINRETTSREKENDSKTHITAKNETARSVKFDEHFARPMSFEGPFATYLNPNRPKETRPKRNLTDIRREKIAINRRWTYFHGKNRWDLRWLRFKLRSSKHRDCSAQRLQTTVMRWRE